MHRKLLLVLTLVCASGAVYAQSITENPHYVGIQPSVLVEPYDTIQAVEVNIFPLVYEYRPSADWGWQVRPLINYRFYELGPGISQVGGTLMVNRYLHAVFENKPKLTFKLGGYTTLATNLLDNIQTITVGIEPGLLIQAAERFSVNVNLQPGINYYPNQFSREFVGTETGFLSHFGVIVHFGWNIGG